MSERKRGIVCAYCGMAWGYEGETPSTELIKEACNHESVCEKNPYISQISNLRRERDEARYQNKKFLEALKWIAERYDDSKPTHQVAMGAYEMSCAARAVLKNDNNK